MVEADFHPNMTYLVEWLDVPGLCDAANLLTTESEYFEDIFCDKKIIKGSAYLHQNLVFYSADTKHAKPISIGHFIRGGSSRI